VSKCGHCGSSNVKKNGRTKKGKQRLYCKDCDRTSTENPTPRGNAPQGDRAASNAERQRKWRAKNKAEKASADDGLKMNEPPIILRLA
jgi:transposase-like protein